MSIRVYNKDQFEALQQNALNNSKRYEDILSRMSSSNNAVTVSPTSEKQRTPRSSSVKRLVMKHELYKKDQEDIQKQIQVNIADSLTKQRNKREANYVKLRRDIDEGKSLAEELEERLSLKEETAKRQKQRLYDEWSEKVFNKINGPINDRVKAMDAKALNLHKQEAYQHFLDTANKKGCLFRDIIIESEYDPLHDNKSIRHVTHVDDPCCRVIKHREEEEAIANEGKKVLDDSMEPRGTGTAPLILGRCDNLDTKLWASGIFESTPYGYFNKMMASTISAESSKTYESRVKFDHYDIEKVWQSESSSAGDDDDDEGESVSGTEGDTEVEVADTKQVILSPRKPCVPVPAAATGPIDTNSPLGILRSMVEMAQTCHFLHVFGPTLKIPSISRTVLVPLLRLVHADLIHVISPLQEWERVVHRKLADNWQREFQENPMPTTHSFDDVSVRDRVLSKPPPPVYHVRYATPSKIRLSTHFELENNAGLDTLVESTLVVAPSSSSLKRKRSSSKKEHKSDSKKKSKRSRHHRSSSRHHRSSRRDDDEEDPAVPKQLQAEIHETIVPPLPQIPEEPETSNEDSVKPPPPHDRSDTHVLCSMCKKSYDMSLLDPPLLRKPQGEWKCFECLVNDCRGWPRRRPSRQVAPPPPPPPTEKTKTSKKKSTSSSSSHKSSKKSSHSSSKKKSSSRRHRSSSSSSHSYPDEFKLLLDLYHTRKRQRDEALAESVAAGMPPAPWLLHTAIKTEPRALVDGNNVGGWRVVSASVADLKLLLATKFVSGSMAQQRLKGQLIQILKAGEAHEEQVTRLRVHEEQQMMWQMQALPRRASSRVALERLKSQSDPHASKSDTHAHPLRVVCAALVTRMIQEEKAPLFSRPVDPTADGCPDYLAIVKHPMDLGTVKLRSLNGTYKTWASFKVDMARIWSNCRLYNSEGAVIVEYANELDKIHLNLVRQAEGHGVASMTEDATNITVVESVDNWDD
ncbi:hypothetical protein DYB30_005487 [Aphanomyces astaci]|uniref:Bromo domain-containing protein n=1 Tax=Aphanomyces astaci TaxID=112090 RepID=A0A397D0T0_APHAT|nr:hypothetical protein DYB30_005487 [Aphanomyces astaci]RHZ23868.1 hypothetical protein DYB26_007851 [Aphanomyces astaci]